MVRTSAPIHTYPISIQISYKLLFSMKIIVPFAFMVTDEEKKMNATYIISVARKIGCTVFLLPEDIMEVRRECQFSLYINSYVHKITTYFICRKMCQK